LKACLRPTELPAPSDLAQQPTPPVSGMATGGRRQRELDELEARMFGMVRGVPVQDADQPDGTVIQLRPEWVAPADDASPPGQNRALGD
jgi:hypothetical protein